MKLEQSELGKTVTYDDHYDPNKLLPISRRENRQEIGINPDALPFCGFDCWNHYEVSWLNAKGKPLVAIAEIVYDCESPCIVESKSLKLYFNTLNNTHFASVDAVQETVRNDLQECIQAPVNVRIIMPKDFKNIEFKSNFEGTCIDDCDLECSVYTVSPSFLTIEDGTVNEVLTSNLLKSNCPVTQQPDWGSVQISYQGRKINREGLLQYIVSFRNHNEFHEQCIERIFMDIMRCCKPEKLTVYGRYTRRGGIDINPYRSTEKIDAVDNSIRLFRQ
ncbi:MAG: NADPH-dependent 7-cyano-7-deazaguanine reductase QueF [Gammaproteobacteria bacterium]|nr:NADPH-dependent 7-cyano-7-deazaguanine reductase QueF [Gammaproteobacteria bacterium]MCH9743304.1 NADPH-dependent 7-cyano-7-deazaguanine reductase QueF [Gammaproteobacteria bacterium]